MIKYAIISIVISTIILYAILPYEKYIMVDTCDSSSIIINQYNDSIRSKHSFINHFKNILFNRKKDWPDLVEVEANINENNLSIPILFIFYYSTAQKDKAVSIYMQKYNDLSSTNRKLFDQCVYDYISKADEGTYGISLHLLLLYLQNNSDLLINNNMRLIGIFLENSGFNNEDYLLNDSSIIEKDFFTVLMRANPQWKDILLLSLSKFYFYQHQISKSTDIADYLLDNSTNKEVVFKATWMVKSINGEYYEN